MEWTEPTTEEEPQRRHRGQRPTHSPSWKSYKDTNYTRAMIHTTQRPCAHGLCARVQTNFEHLDLRAMFTWCPPPSVALTVLPFLLLQGSLSPNRRDSMETCHIGSNVPSSPSLCIMSGCGFLYLFPSAGGMMDSPVMAEQGTNLPL